MRKIAYKIALISIIYIFITGIIVGVMSKVETLVESANNLM